LHKELKWIDKPFIPLSFVRSSPFSSNKKLIGVLKGIFLELEYVKRQYWLGLKLLSADKTNSYAGWTMMGSNLKRPGGLTVIAILWL